MKLDKNEHRCGIRESGNNSELKLSRNTGEPPRGLQRKVTMRGNGNVI